MAFEAGVQMAASNLRTGTPPAQSQEYARLIHSANRKSVEITGHSLQNDNEKKLTKGVDSKSPSHRMWLSYRCFTAKGQERIPIFGDFGLAAQLGSVDYARPRKFRERLERWLDLVQTLWPACPARIAASGDAILIRPATALVAKEA